MPSRFIRPLKSYGFPLHWNISAVNRVMAVSGKCRNFAENLKNRRRMKRTVFTTAAIMLAVAASAQSRISLVPFTPSTAPDYYCTWNLQGYVTSYGAGAGSNDLRMEIHEDNLFGSALGYKAWGREHEKALPTKSLTPNPSPKERGVYTSAAEKQIDKGNHAPLLGRGDGGEAISWTVSPPLPRLAQPLPHVAWRLDLCDGRLVGYP